MAPDGRIIQSQTPQRQGRSVSGSETSRDGGLGVSWSFTFELPATALDGEVRLVARIGPLQVGTAMGTVEAKVVLLGDPMESNEECHLVGRDRDDIGATHKRVTIRGVNLRVGILLGFD